MALLETTTRSLNEKVMEKIPSSKVIDAVIVESSTTSDTTIKDNNTSNNNKVIASDVATRAGISISDARKELTTLASLAKGDISVSSDGELIYEFPSNLKQVLESNSAKYKALQRWEQAWPTIFWFTRISFGVALLVSVALIFSTILVLQTSAGGSSSSDDDNRRDDRRIGGGGGGGGFGFGPSYFWGPSPFDFFYYRPYGGYGYYGQPVTERPRDPEEMGFLESIFSYVFGDGNPNQGLEEQRLQLVAQMIRDNNGAVTAEQLAPYCDAPDPDSSSTTSSDKQYIDESFVLPIVSQLDGQPRVTEEGDIICKFIVLCMMVRWSPGFLLVLFIKQSNPKHTKLTLFSDFMNYFFFSFCLLSNNKRRCFPGTSSVSDGIKSRITNIKTEYDSETCWVTTECYTEGDSEFVNDQWDLDT